MINFYQKLSDEALNKVLLERLGQEESGLSYVTDLNLAWQLGDGIYCSMTRFPDCEEHTVTVCRDTESQTENPFHTYYGPYPARGLVIAWLLMKDAENESLTD